MTKLLGTAAFIATIPMANWFLGNVGTDCSQGPCVIPVAPGVMAPSAVLWIGVAMVLRDYVQRMSGRAWVLGAIIVGAFLSAMLADPRIALASAVSFLLAELLDFGVFSSLERHGLRKAILASSLIAAPVDSYLFCTLADLPYSLIPGMTIGKLYAAMLVTVWLSLKPSTTN